MRDYQKCFVYQYLTYICHGASVESDKFIKVCLDCPGFIAWLEKVMQREKKNENI